MDEQQVEDIVKCSDCGSRNLTRDETRGEVVCDDCGLVLEDNVIDQGAEWRVFSPEQGDQRARTGAPMTVMLHDKGLSTDIDWQNKDYSGKTINSRFDHSSIACENGRSAVEYQMLPKEISQWHWPNSTEWPVVLNYQNLSARQRL